MVHWKHASLLLVVSPTSQQAPAQSSTTGRKTGRTVKCPGKSRLVAYFTFDVDGRDDSGNAHDATISNVTVTSGARGKTLAFGGESSSVRVTGSTPLEARTLCAWIRPDPREGLAHPVFTGGVRDR